MIPYGFVCHRWRENILDDWPHLAVPVSAIWIKVRLLLHCVCQASRYLNRCCPTGDAFLWSELQHARRWTILCPFSPCNVNKAFYILPDAALNYLAYTTLASLKSHLKKARIRPSPWILDSLGFCPPPPPQFRLVQRSRLVWWGA